MSLLHLHRNALFCLVEQGEISLATVELFLGPRLQRDRGFEGLQNNPFCYPKYVGLRQTKIPINNEISEIRITL